MKNLFKKAVSLTIALSTAAALSVSAFATPVATPSESKDAVTVTGYETVGPGQYAVAVVEKTFLGSGTEEDNAKIYYVNQAADTGEVNINTILANMLLKEELAPGNYEVRIGTNATIEAGEHPAYTCIDLVVAAPSTGGDFITSTDTDKGAIETDVVSVTDTKLASMSGCSIISLQLDATKYPNKGTYLVTAVNNSDAVITGANVYYSTERDKYVAVIPKTAVDAGYKFKVVADAGDDANATIRMYGNMNEDVNNNIRQIADYAQFMKVYKGSSDSVGKTDVKKALIADVSGDGSMKIGDYAQFIKAYKGRSDYNFAVLEN